MGIAYNPTIVMDGLVFAIDADNVKSYPGSGSSVLDMSGNNITGSLISSPTVSGGAFNFNGSNYIDVANDPALNPLEITINAWVKSNNSVWNDYGYIVSKRDVYVFHPTMGSTTVEFYCFLNGAWNSISVNPTRPITEWNLYTGSWDGTSLRGYVNGLLVGGPSVRTGPLATNDTGNLSIGRDDGLTRYLDGSIANVSIYNRALSDDEVKQNFNALRGRFDL